MPQMQPRVEEPHHLDRDIPVQPCDTVLSPVVPLFLLGNRPSLQRPCFPASWWPSAAASVAQNHVGFLLSEGAAMESAGVSECVCALTLGQSDISGIPVASRLDAFR